jgi:hypothetical protein
MPALALAPRPTLDVLLQTHVADPSLRLREVTRFAADGGFRANLVVRSGGFSADRPFFFDGVGLARFLDDLQRLERMEPGFARLRASDGPDLVGVQLHGRGDVTVFGALHDHGRVTQSLRFALSTDQTVLEPLRSGLARCWALPAF